MTFIRICLVAIFLLFIQTKSASAALIFTIERISDTEGMLTASGQIDSNVNTVGDSLAFTLLSDGPFGPVTVISQDLKLGDSTFLSSRFRNPSQILIRFTDIIKFGDEISGQMRFLLSGGTMLDVGTQTPVFNHNNQSEAYGTLQFIAPTLVSEPGTIALFLCFILTCAGVRARR